MSWFVMWFFWRLSEIPTILTMTNGITWLQSGFPASAFQVQRSLPHPFHRCLALKRLQNLLILRIAKENTISLLTKWIIPYLLPLNTCSIELWSLYIFFCYKIRHLWLFGGFRLCTVVSCITNLTVIIPLIEKILIILMIPMILIITIILTILLILIILTIHGSTCSTYFWCPEHLCTASSKLRSLHPPWKEKDENLISFFYFTKLTLDSGRGSSPQFHLEQKSGV